MTEKLIPITEYVTLLEKRVAALERFVANNAIEKAIAGSCVKVYRWLEPRIVKLENRPELKFVGVWDASVCSSGMAVGD
jgi:hypothetical protein